MAHLKLTGSGADRKIELTPKTNLVIGRDPGATLPIDDPSSSRLHARVSLSNGAFVVEDLDSKNGTLVNEKPIATHVLTNGDVVRIGGVRLEFHGGIDAPTRSSILGKGANPKIDFGFARPVAKPNFGRPDAKKINTKLTSGKTRRRSPGGGKGR